MIKKTDEADRHFLALTSKPKHLKFMDQATQSLILSLVELILTLEKYPFDVITLTETWLKDYAQHLQYATILGHYPEFGRCNNLRVGGVRAYIRDSLDIYA